MRAKDKTNSCPRCGCPLRDPDVEGTTLVPTYVEVDTKCGHCGLEVEWVLKYVCMKKLDPNNPLC